MKIYSYLNYKDFLKYKLYQEDNTRGSLSRAAKAAGCQASYLSQVVNASVHLTLDHAFALSEYWSLGNVESDYFLTMVERDRAASAPLKNHLKNKLLNMQKENEQLSKRLETNSIEEHEIAHIYYSEWYFAALHFAVGLPGIKNIDDLSKLLRLPMNTTHFALKMLEKNGFISAQSSEGWKVLKRQLHLSNESSLNTINHRNWRNKAMESASFHLEGSLHYSSIHTHSETTFNEIKKLLLELIEKSRDEIRKSPIHTMTGLNIDFYKI